MSNYALIKGGKVINMIVWDSPDSSPIDFDKGVTAVEVIESISAGIGYSYSKGVFTQPPITEEEQAEYDRIALLANVSLKQSLMNEAGKKISVLQDAVDLEIATEAEAAALPLWEKYRVLLNRVNTDTSSEIQWPQQP